jgi:hypothetical protein
MNYDIEMKHLDAEEELRLSMAEKMCWSDRTSLKPTIDAMREIKQKALEDARQSMENAFKKRNL